MLLHILLLTKARRKYTSFFQDYFLAFMSEIFRYVAGLLYHGFQNLSIPPIKTSPPFARRGSFLIRLQFAEHGRRPVSVFEDLNAGTVAANSRDGQIVGTDHKVHVDQRIVDPASG